MDLMIGNGDYIPDGKGALTLAQGADGMLQRVLYRLAVPRGSFLPLPEFGSNLAYLTREKPSTWVALAGKYVQEALVEEQDVELNYVEIGSVEENKVSLMVHLWYRGEALTFQTMVG